MCTAPLSTSLIAEWATPCQNKVYLSTISSAVGLSSKPCCTVLHGILLAASLCTVFVCLSRGEGGGGGHIINEVLYREAPPSGSNPYPLIH